MTTKTKEKRKQKKKRRGPESRDRHVLYEIAVQSPEADVEIFDSVYEKMRGKTANVLKEDFCGTATLSSHWVMRRPHNRAVGVDLDADTLAWAHAHNIDKLEEARSRIELIHDDVKNVRDPKVDIVAALNFSYQVFKTRDALRDYFKAARKSLAEDGIFILDVFGGWESVMLETDKQRHRGFTYIWEQTRYSPITHETEFRIHFRFHDEGGIRDAFIYEWRLWSIPELRELLAEAGFGRTEIYWEGTDPDTGEGNGEFNRTVDEENCPGWNAIIVALD